jgi:hypothetical protein
MACYRDSFTFTFTQINGKFNKNYNECFYSSIEDTEVVPVFERDIAGLKKLFCLNRQVTLSPFLNIMGLLK